MNKNVVSRSLINLKLNKLLNASQEGEGHQKSSRDQKNVHPEGSEQDEILGAQTLTQELLNKSHTSACVRMCVSYMSSSTALAEWRKRTTVY